MSAMARVLSALALCLCSAVGGESPQTLRVWAGSTPAIDAELTQGEWDDAEPITGTKGWTPQFRETTDPADLSLRGWVKHDEQRLYFAFKVTDDVLYGIDTERWLSEKNPEAHELTQKGWPWFGDEMEILINASNQWEGNENAGGTGASWQMVCNLTKSRLHGIGSGGLLEGEPRSSDAAWRTYQEWIQSGAMRAAAKALPGGKGYVIEWSIAFDPCLEVKPGVFYRSTDPATLMGLNIAAGDLDEKSKGEGNFGNFHHEDWWAGHKNTRTNLKDFGTMIMMPQQRPR